MKTLYQGLEFVFQPATRDGISGRWSGAADIRTADGQANRLVLHAILKRDGNTVTGSIGPSPDQQFAIAKGSVTGKSVTFEATMPARLYRFQLAAGPAGSMEGQISSADGKVTGTLKMKSVEP